MGILSLVQDKHVFKHVTATSFVFKVQFLTLDKEVEIFKSRNRHCKIFLHDYLNRRCLGICSSLCPRSMYILLTCTCVRLYICRLWNSSYAHFCSAAVACQVCPICRTHVQVNADKGFAHCGKLCKAVWALQVHRHRQCSSLIGQLRFVWAPVHFNQCGGFLVLDLCLISC